MLPYQERVVEEYSALSEKATTLYSFLATKFYEKLEPEDQHLLRMQYYSMMVYVGILEKRIARF